MTTSRATAKTNPRVVLDRLIDANLGPRSTVLVCRVEEYEINNGVPVADLLPVHRKRLTKGGDEDEFTDAEDILRAPVPPILFGDFVIHAPLKPGDFVVAVASDRSLDEWKENGGTGIEAEDPRRFSQKDAIILWRIQAENDENKPSLSDEHLRIGKRDGSSLLELRTDGSIVMTSNDISLGSDAATQFVALANLVNAELDKLWTTMGSHSHAVSVAGVTLGPSAAAGTAAPIGAQPPSDSVAATKVKAE